MEVRIFICLQRKNQEEMMYHSPPSYESAGENGIELKADLNFETTNSLVDRNRQFTDAVVEQMPNRVVLGFPNETC